MNVRAGAMVPSLKILAVKDQFARNKEAKMLPTLLKCFPRLETLHIMAISSKSPDSAYDPECWESLGPCECLESHLKTIVLYGHLTQNHETGFQKYITREGKVLKTMMVLCSDEMRSNLSSAPLDELNAEVGGGRCDVSYSVVTSPWSFQNATDLALDDPFCVVRVEA